MARKEQDLRSRKMTWLCFILKWGIQVRCKTGLIIKPKKKNQFELNSFICFPSIHIQLGT